MKPSPTKTSDPRVAYHNLTARAPSVRAVWPTYDDFIAAVGRPQSGQRLSRKDDTQPHGPGNTVWTNVHTSHVCELSRKSGLPYHLVYARLRRGTPLRKVLNPARPYTRRPRPADVLADPGLLAPVSDRPRLRMRPLRDGS